MERRKFIQLSTAAGLSTMLACKTETAKVLKETPYMDTLGIQLWTVRNQLAKDALSTLKAIKTAGYRQIELMNLGQLDAYGTIANDLGLDIKCSHLTNQIVSGNWQKLGQDQPAQSPDDLIDKAVKNNLSHITFAYWSAAERKSLDDYKVLAETLNSFGQKCNGAGLKFGYHNHSFEFKPMEGSTGMDILRERIDNDKMQFELDVFWANIGGVNPVVLMNDMKGRIHLLHLKDQLATAPLEYDESKVSPDAFQEVGDGKLDFKAIVDAAVAHGIDYCHVEQDASPDPIESIGQSRKYLANM